MSSTTATLNRDIKRVLTNAFGKGKVSVRGDRGTAYGWVNVKIDWTPRDADQASEMRGHVMSLLAKAGLLGRVGTYGYDDPGSDYGYGNRLSLSFNTPRYLRTMQHSDGTWSVIRVDAWNCEWENVATL